MVRICLVDTKGCMEACRARWKSCSGTSAQAGAQSWPWRIRSHSVRMSSLKWAVGGHRWSAGTAQLLGWWDWRCTSREPGSCGFAKDWAAVEAASLVPPVSSAGSAREGWRDAGSGPTSRWGGSHWTSGGQLRRLRPTELDQGAAGQVFDSGRWRSCCGTPYLEATTILA